MAETMTRAEMASMGGKAAAKRLSRQERSERARNAATARWSGDLPKVTHGSEERPLKIGDIAIPCYVLSNGKRVITNRGLQGALEMSIAGGAKKTGEIVGRIAASTMTHKDLTVRISEPIEFVMPQGGKAYGSEATVLADICDLFLGAKRSGLDMNSASKRIAARCEVLQAGFARVGIVALVDEATGYQSVRQRDALAEYLEAFMAREIRPWAKTFPPEFYRNIFRLRGLRFEVTTKRPQYIGWLTNDVIYRRLAPGVLEELRKKNPVGEKGRRKSMHHQHLSDAVGHPGLREHIKQVMALMRAADTWDQFYALLERSLPVYMDRPGSLLDVLSDEDMDVDMTATNK
jgi:hypothetical protein